MRTQTTRTLLGVLTAIVTALVLSRPVEADPPKPVGARCRHDQNCQSGTCEKALGAKLGCARPQTVSTTLGSAMTAMPVPLISATKTMAVSTKR